jgi:hypothetical protein
MLNVCIKGNLVCWEFVNVSSSRVLKFAGTVKIRGFDTFRGWVPC